MELKNKMKRERLKKDSYTSETDSFVFVNLLPGSEQDSPDEVVQAQNTKVQKQKKKAHRKWQRKNEENSSQSSSVFIVDMSAKGFTSPVSKKWQTKKCIVDEQTDCVVKKKTKKNAERAADPESVMCGKKKKKRKNSEREVDLDCEVYGWKKKKINEADSESGIYEAQIKKKKKKTTAGKDLEYSSFEGSEKKKKDYEEGASLESESYKAKKKKKTDAAFLRFGSDEVKKKKTTFKEMYHARKIAKRKKVSDHDSIESAMEWVDPSLASCSQKILSAKEADNPQKKTTTLTKSTKAELKPSSINVKKTKKKKLFADETKYITNTKRSLPCSILKRKMQWKHSKKLYKTKGNIIRKKQTNKQTTNSCSESNIEEENSSSEKLCRMTNQAESVSSENSDDNYSNLFKASQKLKSKKFTQPVSNKKKIWAAKVLDGSESVLLFLKHPLKLTLYGRAKIKVLFGSVSLLGSHLLPCDWWHDVYSPNSHSLLLLETVSGLGSAVARARHFLLEHTSKKQLADKINETTVILHIKEKESPICSNILKFRTFSHLFKMPHHIRYYKYNQVLWSFGFSVSVNLGAETMLLSEEYCQIFDKWQKMVKYEDSPVVLVCGPQKTGKSTLCRMMINSTLNVLMSSSSKLLRSLCARFVLPLFDSSENVCYIEGDIGQTEFTPSGCVCLKLLCAPVFGPPFSHQKEPLLNLFVGEISPSYNPDCYISCIKSVFSYYQQMSPRPSLVVNTMGWIRGLGLKLLIEIIRFVKPDLVIQLTTADHERNLPDLYPDFVQYWTPEESVAQSKNNYLESIQNETTEQPAYHRYQLQQLKTTYWPKYNEVVRELSNADLRTLNLLSYLVRNLSPDVTLYSCEPYIVPWNSVAIDFCRCVVPRSQIMYALNASIVGLCYTDLSQAFRPMERDDLPWCFKKIPLCECIGLGFVRGIDPEKKLLYIVTPLPPKKLCRVNTLMKSNLNLSGLILSNQKCSPLIYLASVTSTEKQVIDIPEETPTIKEN